MTGLQNSIQKFLANQWLSLALLWTWIIILLNLGFLWSWLAALLGLPIGLVVYASLHNHFHTGGRKRRRWLYDLLGILRSAPLGLSWIVYQAHHANHHKYNNGQKDWSCTVNTDGTPMKGTIYLWRSAIKPSILQLIPFLILVLFKRERRRLLIDELARVALRLVVFLVLGWTGLLLLIWWQFLFIIFLNYSNYLQHHEADGGVIWDNIWFNTLCANLGFHDLHHANPALEWPKLYRHGSGRKIGIFNPRIFWVFLVRPNDLKTTIGEQNPRAEEVT